MSFVCAFIRQGWTYFLLNYYRPYACTFCISLLFNTPEKLEQALAQFLSVGNGQGHVYLYLCAFQKKTGAQILMKLFSYFLLHEKVTSYFELLYAF